MPTYKQMPRGHSTPGIDVPTAGQVFARLRPYKRHLLIGVGVCLAVVLLWGGSVYYRWHRNQEAVESYATLPVETEARAAGLKDLAERYPKTGAGIHARFALGQKAFQGEHYEEAVWAYFPLTRLSDRHAMVRSLARHNLGAVYEAQGNWEGALEIYQAAALDPVNLARAASYYDLARAYQAIGKKEDAIEWYEKASSEGLALWVGDQAKERLKWFEQ